MEAIKLFTGLADDDLIKVDEIARRVSRSVQTTKRWARTFDWPVVRFGGDWACPVGALRARAIDGTLMKRPAPKGRKRAA